MLGSNSSKTEPGQQRSPEAERVLREALAAVVPVHRLTYQRRWFAGLSDFPGNGMEHVELARSGDRFVGSASIEFRGAFGGTATCTAPIEIAGHRLEALFQALASPELGYGVVGVVAPDYTEHRRISFEAISGQKLALVMGYGVSKGFWGHVRDDEFVSSGTDVCGLQAPEFSAINALLDERCGLSAQTSALWKALKDWSLFRRAE